MASLYSYEHKNKQHTTAGRERGDGREEWGGGDGAQGKGVDTAYSTCPTSTQHNPLPTHICDIESIRKNESEQ